ncbi:uncharacterized protein LOC5507516 isoform X1 [Nematostella vectensis]|uniref:uncharacterized protein LOC5507516 isoform X1 n=1 Tax=Nematostella vectensis TaxID=45351 RepID=UPI0020775763|nr:uncharacterized protein LOC5507516 isoform X1 [Nematostella vectensis]
MKPLKTRLGFIVFQCKYAVLRYCRQAVFERPYNGRFASQAAFPARRNNPKNHYDVMKLLPTATQREIKSAYYELSRIYHPDLNSSAEARERFAELTLAYNTLSRLETRREYDKQIGTYYMTRSLTRKSEGERVLRLMDDLVEIDATGIEQTSSFLGAGIPLNTILGLPVRLNNIHGPKASYGLQPHDVRMLHLLRQICSGTLVASKGSSTVTFLPGDLQAGIFSSEGGNAGYVFVFLFVFYVVQFCSQPCKELGDLGQMCRIPQMCSPHLVALYFFKFLTPEVSVSWRRVLSLAWHWHQNQFIPGTTYSTLRASLI